MLKAVSDQAVRLSRSYCWFTSIRCQSTRRASKMRHAVLNRARIRVANTSEGSGRVTAESIKDGVCATNKVVCDASADHSILSLEEIRTWAEMIAAESTLKLIKFCYKPEKRTGRAVTQIVFGQGGDEYRAWIFPEFNIIYVDAFHEGVENDTTLFRGAITRRSLNFVSWILRQPPP